LRPSKPIRRRRPSRIVETFYDAAVSGADPVNDGAGFAQMLERLLSNGARTILVESPDRFARDLMVQLAGHDMLKAKGISLIAASAPTFFIEDTPTVVLVRQVLDAVAQFETATTVAKLAAARRRKRMTTGEKVEDSTRAAGALPRRWLMGTGPGGRAARARLNGIVRRAKARR
jgi:DNA invertase Pin-like site-specific DNA recombinase